MLGIDVAQNIGYTYVFLIIQRPKNKMERIFEELNLLWETVFTDMNLIIRVMLLH